MACVVFGEHLGGKVGKEAAAVHMVDLPVRVLCSDVESILFLPAFTLWFREKDRTV